MMKKKEIFPDFMIAGVTKCGSTSLYTWLDQHPDIYMCKPHKEPVFFDAEYELGRDYYWERYFSSWNGESLVGEANARDLVLPFLPERIRSVNPDVKFIVSMRNPVDRALAHWWHLYYRRRSYGWETLAFEEAIDDNLERLAKGLEMDTHEEIKAYSGLFGEGGAAAMGLYRTYVDAGHYADNLKRYFEFFPRESFKLVLLDDLVSDPEGLMRDIFTFLAVDTAPSKDIVYAAEKVKKDMSWGQVFRQYFLNLSTKKLGYLMRGGHAVRARPEMSAETRCRLVEHYREHNKRLEEILGRSLEHWNA